MKKPRSQLDFVSRAGFKLASVVDVLQLDFKDKIVLDVGSSTGGFTDFALKNMSKKVIAVDAGKHQLHSSLRNDPRIELHEQVDIRDIKELSAAVDIVLVDVSFVSLRDVLPHIRHLITRQTQLVVLLKPQFEAIAKEKHQGIIKNERIRRQILKAFETWAKQDFIIVSKTDSKIFGTKGNKERFYLLQKH
jgi:23S rRNA (cytidine1920-2'-O)/16S rRNA (cytidine1409-2'-O)-methyltransferase